MESAKKFKLHEKLITEINENGDAERSHNKAETFDIGDAECETRHRKRDRNKEYQRLDNVFFYGFLTRVKLLVKNIIYLSHFIFIAVFRELFLSLRNFAV